MKFTLFGKKFNVVHVLLVIVAVLLVTHLVSGCSNCSLSEGMQAMGAELNYKMGEGVKNSWETREQQQGPSIEWREQNHDAYQSQFVGPEQSLSYFAATDFAPECCGSSYSGKGGLTAGGATSGGCACMNKEQIEYINERGGNRTGSTEF